VAYSSEIDKLRARYAENPKGRNFAPLADAYRKAKQLDEAIALCREGLQHHPDYVSAHIVLGRCLVDKQEDGAAAIAFRRVLELDPENIIALKLLSDIALRADHPHEAVDWLSRLLQVDPMNGDASEALTAARARAAGAAPAAVPPTDAAAGPVAEPAGEAAPAPAAEAPRPVAATVTELPAMTTPPVAEEAPPVVDATPAAAAQGSAPRPAEEPAPPEAPGRTVPSPSFADAPTEALRAPDFTTPPEQEDAGAPAIESYDGAIDFSGVESGAQSLAGFASEEPVVDVSAEEVAPAQGLARTQYEGSGMFRIDNDAAEGNIPRASRALGQTDAEAPTDLPLILPEGVAQGAPQRPAERLRETQPEVPRPEDGPEARRDEELAAAAAPAPSPPALSPSAEGEGAPAMAVPTTPDDEGAADAAALSAAEPLLTETMAEVYLQQGHVEQALAVYRGLLTQRPGDADLRAKVDSLAGPGAGRTGTAAAERPMQSALEYLRNVFAGDRSSPPVPLEARDGEGGTPAESLMDKAFAEPAAEDNERSLGAPTQPARDALSLDRVFGESGAVEASAPAEPGVEKGAAVGAPVGFSFDDFFAGGEEEPTVGTPSGSGPPSRAGGRPARSAEAEQDLDQFQAWLRSLKT